tara:strand:- start:58868 stop:59170 length:303 start_codon:yes stop_codon:yes gene_type:complete
MPLITTLFGIIQSLLTLYMFAFIIMAILSWLVAFNIVNTQNKFVYMVGDFLHRITEPLLQPIRRILPDLGGIDITPVFAIIAIILVRDGLLPTIFQILVG